MLYVLADTPHFYPASLCQSDITANLLSMSMVLPGLDSLEKWHHPTCDLLCLASFPQCLFRVHPSISPLFLFVVELDYFVIYLSVNGHVGGCHFLTVTNNTTVNVLVQVFGWRFSLL